MKVLFVVSAGADSGITTSAKTLASKLEEKGINVETDNFDGTGFDLVHFHNPLPTTFFFSNIAFRKLPFVCTTNMTSRELDGLLPKPLVKLSPKYLEFYYSRCDKILCTGSQLINELKEKGFEDKIVPLALPVDEKMFHQNKKLGEEFKKKHGLRKKIVLSIASVQKRKGVFDFVEVAKQLPEYNFVWVGAVPPFKTMSGRRRIKKIMKEQKNVLFPGYCSYEELASAYNAADLFVSPSYSETFGLTIVEAAFCKLPVIVRNLEVLDNFKDFAVYFNDNKDLAEKISSILKNEKERKKLGNLSFEKSQKFSAENHVKKLIKVYDEAIKENKEKQE